MDGLFAFERDKYAGRVVDSGFSSQHGKWVTVLDDDGTAVTDDEGRWRYVRPEDMVHVDPQAVDALRHDLEGIWRKLRAPHLDPEVRARLEGKAEGMAKVLRGFGLGDV